MAGRWGGDAGVPIVLPWSGPRAPLRPLDFSGPPSSPDDEIGPDGKAGEPSEADRWGSGMLRRRMLHTHTLEEEFLIPVPPRRR